MKTTQYIYKDIKNKIVSVSSLILLSITLSACGGGSGGSFTNSQNVIAIDVECVTPSAIETYIKLESGDTISIASGTPTIVTYHDTNGTKRVCLDSTSSGTANILR